MKGTCPECREEVVLRQDGTLRRHGYTHAAMGGNECQGSGKKPAVFGGRRPEKKKRILYGATFRRKP
jgi:hypothetical protein